jgi:hypothetical protein
MSDNKIAFIIGNGKSRQAIDLSSLVGKGTIFGCNALYRNFSKSDYLVAIDDRMIKELLEITLDDKHPSIGEVIIPPEDERWESAEYSPNRRRSNAGMNAMLEAIRREHNILYCLGFDFILEGEKSIENIYKGSKNYEPSTQSTTSDNYFRVRYCDWFVNQHDSVKFVFVVPDNVATKKLESKNIIGMKMSTFNNKIKGTS